MAHDGEQVAAGRSVLLIEREVKVLDLINFSLPLPRLHFHPGESVDGAHGDVIYLVDRSEAWELFELDLNALIKVQDLATMISAPEA
jgi:hypothetical protein